MNNLATQTKPFSLLNQIIDACDRAMEEIYGENKYRVIQEFPDENSIFPCVIIKEINNTPNSRYSTMCDYRYATNFGYEIQFFSNKTSGANEQNMQNWQIVENEMNKIGLHQTYFSSDVPNLNNRHIKRMIARYAGVCNREMEVYFR